jgi:hypothetical protein
MTIDGRGGFDLNSSEGSNRREIEGGKGGRLVLQCALMMRIEGGRARDAGKTAGRAQMMRL